MEKRQHFENMERTCVSSYIALIPSLKETFIRCLDVDSLTDSLKNRIPNKLEVWDRLKVIAFTRIIVTIYGTSLLNVLLRIQLSVIGGYLFQEAGSDQKKATMRNIDGVILSHVTAIDTDLQHKYLSLANYLVQGGMEELCDYVLAKSESVVGRLSLKQKVTISDLEEMFWSIISSIKVESEPENVTTVPAAHKCRNPTKHPWNYIFPKDILESQNYFRNVTQPCRPHYEPPDLYQRLMGDTFDLLESDDVCGILHSFESHGISHFLDRLAESIQELSLQTSTMSESVMESSSDGSNPVFNETVSMDQRYNLFREIAVPIAKLIPVMNGLSLASLNGTDPWILLLVHAESVSTLGANVYESFSTPS